MVSGLTDADESWEMTLRGGEDYALLFAASKQQEKLKPDDLIRCLRDRQRGMPFRHLMLPAELSRRPLFLG